MYPVLVWGSEKYQGVFTPGVPVKAIGELFQGGGLVRIHIRDWTFIGESTSDKTFKFWPDLC